MAERKEPSTCSAGSSTRITHNVTGSKNSGRTTYGELYVIGCNGTLPAGKQTARLRAKFTLEQREKPNGVKRARSSIVEIPHSSEIIRDPNTHTIHYTTPDNETVVEYIHDEETDMFQIGRGHDESIDFIILDNYNLDRSKSHPSNVSRFACRIIAERSNPANVRLYAAGFDTKRNIYLGIKAVKWKTNDNIDALTTNGVLLSNPEGKFCGGDVETSVWREVSVCGNIFSVRRLRSSPEKGKQIENATNLLKDGSLIDLCGVTLLWRTPEGLKSSPTKEYIESLIENLSNNCEEVPAKKLRMNSFVLPRNISHGPDDGNKLYTFIYLNCGHVHGGNSLPSECPSCCLFGPTQKLCMGMEAGFYVDDVSVQKPHELYAFNPCGHITTEKTARFWSKASVPRGTKDYYAVCPFCACQLQGYPGYILLKLGGKSS